MVNIKNWYDKYKELVWLKERTGMVNIKNWYGKHKDPVTDLSEH